MFLGLMQIEVVSAQKAVELLLKQVFKSKHKVHRYHNLMLEQSVDSKSGFFFTDFVWILQLIHFEENTGGSTERFLADVYHVQLHVYQ